MQLNGKTVLITGGRRVGARLAVQLAERGARIALSYFKSRERMEQVAREVRNRGAECLLVPADLRDPRESDALVAATCREWGAISALVNMTSEFQPTPFDELTPADFERNLASNLSAPYFTSLAVARAMRQQPVCDGLQGKIIHFVDWAVDRPYKNFLPYLVAKGGLVTLTKALAVELAPTIAVNAIAPAMIDPPPHLSAEEIEEIRQASPLRRIGRPEDATNLVLYLLEGSDFVTGSIFRIDGGRFLGTDSE